MRERIYFVVGVGGRERKSVCVCALACERRKRVGQSRADKWAMVPVSAKLQNFMAHAAFLVQLGHDVLQQGLTECSP